MLTVESETSFEYYEVHDFRVECRIWWVPAVSGLIGRISPGRGGGGSLHNR